MIHVYDCFIRDGLYCDIKFYRVSKIRLFLEIRKYNNELIGSPEFLIYSSFFIRLNKISKSIMN